MNNNYKMWKKNFHKLNAELQKMFNNLSENEIKESFDNELVFGTAGLRGIIGAGTGRMNLFTVRRATLAFIKFLQQKYSPETLMEKGVVIGCDNRKWSLDFQNDTAKLFAANNIRAKIYANNELIPTPVVSFSVKSANCIGGIVITASHNPREYNGYKIYDENGCQYLPEATNIITEFYNNISEEVFDQIDRYDESNISYLGDETKQKYLDMINSMQFYPGEKKKIKIIFSNFHGTSKTWTPVILEKLGYDVITVKEQYEYDENFTNAPSPNPEILSNYELAISYAKKNDADLIIVNDPDADRIGIGVKNQKTQEFQLLTGNETAPIMLEYWISQQIKFNQLPPNPVMYNTFVTGNLSDKVCEKYKVKVIKTLTGFKWIGSRIPLEKAANLNFIFGFEEAYGYVLNPKTRDKDGIQSAIVIAEAANYYYEQGKTLIDVLDDIYQEFGYYYCYTVNDVYEGLAGQKIINNILQGLRSTDIDNLNSIKCIKKEDYINGLYDMPGQDLLKFYFEDGSWLAVRGSGTEPKIKYYYNVVSTKSIKDAKIKQDLIHQDLKNKYLKIFEGNK